MKERNKSFSFKKQYSLLLEMVRTDFKLRYQASVLGYVWSVLKPLFLFAILYIVFSKFLRLGAGVPNYAISLLLGIVIWNFFAEATAGGLKSVVGKGNLIRKIYIPRYLIPISTVASATINMFLNLIVVFIFVLFASNTALGWSTIIIFPLLVVQLIIFTTGVSFFLAAVYVKFRDIDYIWEVARQALFYSIPIIYPLSRIPYDWAQKIIMTNPIAEIVQGMRKVVTYNGTQSINDVFGSPFAIFIPLSITLLAVILGITYFNKHSKNFAENV